MAYLAQVRDGVVVQVIVVHEAYGDLTPEEWAAQRLRGTWVRTDLLGLTRKHYAGLGYAYDTRLDAFVPPRPYPSWELNDEQARYQAPVAMPDDGREYLWDEPRVAWVLDDGGSR